MTVDYSLLGGVEQLPPSLSNAHSSDDESSSSTSSPPLSRAVSNQKSVDKTDWLWSLNEEPHRSRRKVILSAHPEVSWIALLFIRARVDNPTHRLPN